MNITSVLSVWINVNGKRYLGKADSASEGVVTYLFETGDELRLKFSRYKKCCAVAASCRLTEGNAFSASEAVVVTVRQLDGISEFVTGSLSGQYWCNPSFGYANGAVPDGTQTLLYKRGSSYGNLTAFSHRQYKSVFRGEDGVLSITVKAGVPLSEIDEIFCLFCEDVSAYTTVQKITALGFQLKGFPHRSKPRPYPDIFKYLGWCTWDAFNVKVNESGVLAKCEEFKRKGVPVKWLLLDDMWADVKGLQSVPLDDYEKMVSAMRACSLYEFVADPERFPDGVAGTVNKVAQYGIKTGVWYPTTGYWNGVDPDGVEYRKDPTLFAEINGRLLPDFKSGKAELFYDACNRYLSQQGVSFVKVDNQSVGETEYGGYMPVGEFAEKEHCQIERSVYREFDAMINCMGMATENYWNRPQSSLMRVSGDFMPENKEWFRRHLMQCVYNSFFYGSLIWCDWDMWWTDDEQAEKNAVLRALSGGPVYVSDKVGRTRPQALKPLMFADGRILRCDHTVRPTPNCVTRDPSAEGEPFTFFNSSRRKPLVCAFNFSSEAKSIDVPTSFRSGVKHSRFAVYARKANRFFVKEENENLQGVVQADDWELFVCVPIRDGKAVFGDLTKYVSPAAITGRLGNKITTYEDCDITVYSEKPLNGRRIADNVYVIETKNKVAVLEDV